MKHISGCHLILDGYVQDEQRLEKDTMFSLFDELVDRLGMKYLTLPEAHKVDLNPDYVGGEEDDGGWTYWCTITTSHISAHTWPLRKAIMLDVFSCRPFDVAIALNIISDSLGLTSYRKHVVNRSGPRSDDWSASVCGVAKRRDDK